MHVSKEYGKFSATLFMVGKPSPDDFRSISRILTANIPKKPLEGRFRLKDLIYQNQKYRF
ncbi:hypothetical protein HMPREF9103_02193 [Lentilactobacillus parafarraginis F0439]|uniref:Uncharacterized protein n=1 Tax=Lentilactobacillus parafarraginis F0439 TaxID=797515 RepID=G9ZR32_9LACO|nr:hypothetical protein HMPREF9103_02193 [Lentilactobacillus parafarraginis F0439]